MRHLDPTPRTAYGGQQSTDDESDGRHRALPRSLLTSQPVSPRSALGQVGRAGPGVGGRGLIAAVCRTLYIFYEGVRFSNLFTCGVHKL